MTVIEIAARFYTSPHLSDLIINGSTHFDDIS